MDSREYTLKELAAASGLPARTVRYYVAEGLLPSPGRQGPATRYPEGTLKRLTLIKRLRAANLALAEIRDRVAVLSDDDVASALKPRGLAQQVELSAGTVFPPVYRVPPPVSDAYLLRSRTGDEWARTAMTRARTHWERISLEAGVELHVQRPLNRLAAKRVERLVAYAGELQARDLEGIS